jgi:Uncharacterized protein conserved in bacteria
MSVRCGLTLFLALLCLSILPAAAQDGLRTEGEVAAAQGLYAAEVPVGSQVDSARQAGYARALAQVLSKLSGDAAVVNRPGVAQELRNAEAYVEGYDYRQDQSTSPGGAPTYRTMLVVRFVPEAVDAMVSALGLPVWGQPRPKPVVWLAIDDGSGPRLLGTGQSTPPARCWIARSSAATGWACLPAAPPSRRWSARSGAAIPRPWPAHRRATARRCS